MKIAMFYHSLVSDWNHGNAHFLRGVVTELMGCGHEVRVFEPRDNWSAANLLADQPRAIDDFHAAYPHLRSTRYDLATLDLDADLNDVDLVIVHEWNDHDLVARIGAHRAGGGRYRLLFHDTHHRSVTDPAAMARYDLSHYDGVLAFGRVIRDIYLRESWAKAAWTWHEAADTRVFRHLNREPEGDLVWIGNWGDDERAAELHEFLIEPVRRLSLRARVYGVRYPQQAIEALDRAGIEYGGYLPNYHAPEVFARYRFTVHVPRRPYVRALPGVPTIRVFEALACGIPLISAPWEDAERLFTPGRDYLVARDAVEMEQQIRRVLDHPDEARQMAERAPATILRRHTCAHRVRRLLAICRTLGLDTRIPSEGTQPPEAPKAPQEARSCIAA